jgi:diaminopimelate decarboxylase
VGLTQPALALAQSAADEITATPMPAYPDFRHDRVLDDPTLLGDIAFAVGGPFHLIYPDRVADNTRSFHQAFERTATTGAVYYSKKANKARSVARACAESDAGMDVSSLGELTSAMAAGIRGTDLMVTGSGKTDELLWPAIRHGALIAVDSLEELDRVTALCRPDMPAWILLRVRPPAGSSRFGLTEPELTTAVHRIDPDGPVTLEGFGFHLTGYEPAPRATLAMALIDRCRTARTLGHSASTISIGGGFAVDYVDADHWDRFAALADRRWFHAGRTFDEFYPYHCPVAGADMLVEILGTAGLSGKLSHAGIRLAIEPGRALLDGAGCTVFRVADTKTRLAHGHPYQLITVDGSSLSLSEQWFASEYLPDPVLWPRGMADDDVTPTCVGGATCLESDMLSWRRIPLARRARVGDLLVYPNTAGYQMDSNESEFHELPLPPKVVLHQHCGRFRWTLDR